MTTRGDLEHVGCSGALRGLPLHSMQTWADDEHERLNRIYGDQWNCWYVPKFPVGYTWHARPKGHPVSTIHADTPEELSAAISEASLAG
jgi:hypothetical protein